MASDSSFRRGANVYIEFSRGIAQGEMPPLFIIGPEGGTELVSYRARRQIYYIVDRLFAAAELRLGGDKHQKVRIVRRTIDIIEARPLTRPI